MKIKKEKLSRKLRDAMLDYNKWYQQLNNLLKKLILAGKFCLVY